MAKTVAQMRLTGFREGMAVSVAIEVAGDRKADVTGLAEFYGKRLEDLGLQESYDTALTPGNQVTSGLPVPALELLMRLLNQQPVTFECAGGIGRFVVKTHGPTQPIVFGVAAALELNKAGLVEWRVDGLHLTPGGAEYARYLADVGDIRD